MRKLIKILIPLVIVVALSACNDETELNYDYSDRNIENYVYTFISFDVLIYEDIEDMSNKATHIIRGYILDRRFEWLDPSVPREITEQLLREQGLTEEEIDFELEGITFERDLELVTTYRIRVLEIFQGDHNINDVIEVSVLGGEYGSERWVVDDSLEIELNSELVLFLVSWGMINQPYSLISHVQGVYHIPELEDFEENLIDIIDVEIELEGVSEMDPISITIEDLIEIAEINGLLDDD